MTATKHEVLLLLANPRREPAGAAREPEIIDAATVVGMSHDGPRHDYTELHQPTSSLIANHPCRLSRPSLAVVSPQSRMA